MRDEVLNFLDSVKTGKNDYNSSNVGARTIEMIDEAAKSIRVVK
jgi:hypothetical protein